MSLSCRQVRCRGGQGPQKETDTLTLKSAPVPSSYHSQEGARRQSIMRQMGEKRAPQESKSSNSSPALTVDVSARVSIPMKDTMNKSILGREGFIYLTLLVNSLSLREVRTGTQPEQEAGGKNRGCRGHGGMVLMGLLNLISYSVQDHLPRGGSTHINNQSRKCPHRPVWWGHFFS